MPDTPPSASVSPERQWVSPSDFITLPAVGRTQKQKELAMGERQGRRPSARNKAFVMRRKKRTEEPENHERWLVSYADFVTLLFAFFVVMYAISSVNEGKYRILSDSLVTAFRSDSRSLAPIQVGELTRSTTLSAVALKEAERLRALAVRANPSEPPPTSDSVPTDGVGQKALDDISEQIVKNLADLIDKGLISLRRDKLWLEVEIKTSILYSSGSAALEKTALPVLAELANILKAFPNPIQVEGFTDDRPINSVVYPSNWELSAGRAASVVHVFSRTGVQPERMAAIGYGEYRPIVSNETPEGRNRNRRVVLHILAHADAGRILGIEQGSEKAH